MSKHKLVFIVLNYIVCIIALVYIAAVALHYNFDFSVQGRMTHPGMVIAFLSACALNIARLNAPNIDMGIVKVSVFSNILTLSLASAFAFQNPIFSKLVTTCLMAIITVNSLIELYKQRLTNQRTQNMHQPTMKVDT